MAEFMLWLEFEHITSAWNSSNEVSNVHVTLTDGRRYRLEVWTYKFLSTLVGWDVERGDNLNGLYQTPPDLFVRELTRECVESAITDLLKRGNLESMLNPSIIDSSLAEDDD